MSKRYNREIVNPADPCKNTQGRTGLVGTFQWMLLLCFVREEGKLPQIILFISFIWGSLIKSNNYDGEKGT